MYMPGKWHLGRQTLWRSPEKGKAVPKGRKKGKNVRTTTTESPEVYDAGSGPHIPPLLLTMYSRGPQTHHPPVQPDLPDPELDR